MHIACVLTYRHTWECQRNFWESILSFHVGHRDQTEIGLVAGTFSPWACSLAPVLRTFNNECMSQMYID